MKNILIGLVFVFGFACDIGRDIQPGLSHDPFSIQRFNDSYLFPYTASVERRQQILDTYSKVQNGMKGDDVLRIMGSPDEVSPLRFVGGPTRGWAWYYFINKEFARAPDDYDNHVRIFFDKSGAVDEMTSKLDAPQRPTPLPTNMLIKVANVNRVTKSKE